MELECKLFKLIDLQFETSLHELGDYNACLVEFEIST